MAMKSIAVAIDATMRSDPSISEGQRRAVLDVLDGKSAEVYVNIDPIDRVLPRKSVSVILGVSPRTVTAYAKRGLLKAVKNGPGGVRSCGYSEASVRALVEGLDVRKEAVS